MAVTTSMLRTELLSSARASLYSALILQGSYLVAHDLNSYGSVAVSIGTVYSLALQQAVSAGEYALLSAGQRDMWGAVLTTAVHGVAISNAQIRAQVAYVWSATTTTRAALLALDTKFGSRAEALFGEHETVTAQDVEHALGIG